MPDLENIDEFLKVYDIKKDANNLLANYLFSYQIWPFNEWKVSIYSKLEKHLHESIFSSTIIKVKRKERIENVIVSLYTELERALMKYKDILEPGSYDLSDLESFSVEDLKENLGNRNKHLQKAATILRKNKTYFNVALLSGSLGTNDYKTGWSDTDIFIVIARDVVLDVEKLKKLRKIMVLTNNEIYKYSILQLHSLFVTTEIDFALYLNSSFPKMAVINSKLLCKSTEKIDFFKFSDEWDALEYFSTIHRSSMSLCRNENRSSMETVLLYHRIYSFPFAFLQCLGIHKYKRESFQYLIDNYSTLFSGIDEFYRDANSFYHDWEVRKMNRGGLRNIMLGILPRNIVNNAFLEFEKDINRQLARGVEILQKNNITVRYENYLKIAAEYLEEISETLRYKYKRY